MTKVNPVKKNASATVGLCEGKMSDAEYIGKFNADVLIEWANAIAYNHGHQQVYVYCHHSERDDVSAKSMAASDVYNDEMFTVCVGCEDTEDLADYFKANPKPTTWLTKCEGCRFLGKNCQIFLQSQAYMETLLSGRACKFKEPLPKKAEKKPEATA